MRTLRQAAVLLHPGKDQTTSPLRGEEIYLILRLFLRDNIDSLVIRVGIQLGIAGALRGLEYFAPSNSFRVTEKRKLLYVRRDRIFLHDPKDPSSKHFALYWFFKSKKNQTYKREVATLPCSCDNGYCIVADLKLLINNILDCKPGTVLLTWSDGKFVTASQLRTILKNACTIIGSNPEHVATHSLRKTAITEAINAGIPDTVVTQLARWGSFASIRPYIDLHPMDLVAVRSQTQSQSSRKQDNQCQRFRRFAQSERFVQH